ncbi:T9SS type A sorting domain-containing protein [Nostoc ellipsosporum NOK]|nr:T9SS type A sorting domain-containing protein [Nostoc ellipsosporum NOK]
MQFNKLKRWAVTGILLLVGNQLLLAQQVTATIKPGTAATEVDIYVKSTAATGAQYFTNLIFSVGIQTSCITGPVPKADLTYLGSTGMTWASADDGGTQITGTTITSPTTTTSPGYTVYTFNGTQTNTTAANIPANTEVKLGTIKFSGGTGTCPVFLMNNGSSSFDYFYMTLNTSGEVVDVNDFNNNTYAVSPNTLVNDGTVGVKTGANISLPIRLTSFEASQDGRKVKLEWKTSYELNTAMFQVERSIDGGNTFVQIAQVAATGYASGSTYQAEDGAPVKGANYYRLKIVDRDGRVSYSAVRVVRFDAEQTGKVQAYPTNNSTGSLYVELPRGWEHSSITLMNAVGQRMDASRIAVSSSLNRVVSLRGLSAGMYLVTVINDQSREQQVIKVTYQP